MMFRSTVHTVTPTELSDLVQQLQDEGHRIRQVFQEVLDGTYRYRVFTEETKYAQQRDAIIADLLAGRSLREIAKYHEVSTQQVIATKRAAQENGVTFPGGGK
jgi:hypothetical protein